MIYAFLWKALKSHLPLGEPVIKLCNCPRRLLADSLSGGRNPPTLSVVEVQA